MMDKEHHEKPDTAEDQLELGKHHLSLAEAGTNPEQNGKLAVDWLIKSSRRGNEEATELLRVRCLKNKLGVTDENLVNVKWCIKTSASEKKIRHAAQKLFYKINTLHKDVLTKNEYMAAISAISFVKGEKKLLESAGKNMGDAITEDKFVKTVSKRIQGRVQPTLTEMSTASDEYETAPLLEKVRKHPRQVFMNMSDQVLEYASKEGVSWMMKLIPVHQVQILLLLFMYSFITPRFFFLIIPLLLFYISFIVSVITTLQMFYGKRKLSSVKAWTNILSRQDIDIDLESAESQYTWNTLTPYIVYFGSIFVAILCFAIADKTYIPCSEICALSVFFSIFCSLALNDNYDQLTWISYFFILLTNLPTILQNSNSYRIPIIATIIDILTDPFITFNITSQFKINLGLPSLAMIGIPIILVFMAAQKSWCGIYRILIPHLICIYWMNFGIAFFPYSTWIGLTRATVGYLMLPVMMPFVVLGGAAYIAYVFMSMLKSDVFGKIGITVMLLAIPTVLFKSKLIFGAKFDKKFGKYKKKIMLFCGILSIVPIIFVRLPTTTTQTDIPDLKWEMYKESCGQITPNTNIAQLQMGCSHLKGVKVMWSGKVTNIQVTDTDNSVEKVIAGLPEFIAAPLRCIYGERYQDCNDAELSIEDRKYCVLNSVTGRSCHTHSQDTHDITISVLPNNDSDQPIFLSISSGGGFRNTLLALAPGDMIDFKAVLNGGMGTVNPRLSLRQIACTSRVLPVMMELEEEEESAIEKLNESISVACHFFLYPLFEFSPME